MTAKRGQITIFLIIGVIIFISVSLIIYLKDSVDTGLIKEETEFSTAAQPVAPFVEQCIRKTLQQAIIITAENGGYYELPELSTKEAYKNAPYYIYGNEKHLPQRPEESIKLFLEDNLRFCTKGFTELPGLTILYEAPTATIMLGENIVTATIDYPLKIEEPTGTITKMSRFQSSTPTKILQMFETAKAIIETPIMFESHCLTCINDIIENSDFTISMVDDYEGTFFAIVDNTTTINEEPIRYRFATLLTP